MPDLAGLVVPIGRQLGLDGSIHRLRQSGWICGLAAAKTPVQMGENFGHRICTAIEMKACDLVMPDFARTAA
jgi:hypothetical protein